MARARKSHKTREEDTRPTRNGVLPPYRTSKPGANPYVVYCDYRRPDVQTPKVLILAFGEKYSASWFIRHVLDGDTYHWAKPIGSRDCIETDNLGIRISMFQYKNRNDLEMLLEYEPTAAEAEWSDEQVVKQIRRFKYGVSEDDRSQRVSNPSPSSDDTGRGEDPVHTGRKGKVKKEKKEPKPKIDKTGLVSAGDIAKELGCEPREVRVVLRAMKLEKPEGGWLFDKKTAGEIKDKVKEGLKQAKAKKGKK